jgi:hypothetical protein
MFLDVSRHAGTSSPEHPSGDAPAQVPGRVTAGASAGVALVVLGCALRRAVGVPAFEGALRRRVMRGAREWERAQREDPPEERPPIVVVSGGRTWAGEVEADAMAEGLVGLGVPAGVIVRERASLTTRDNARFTAASCARRQIGRVAIVTCRWHLPRAKAYFEAEGLAVVKLVSAGEADAGWGARAWLEGKERLLRALGA